MRNALTEDRLPLAADWLKIWEQAGPVAVERDLLVHDGKHLCGGLGRVRREAWRWLRLCRASALKQAYDRDRPR